MCLSTFSLMDIISWFFLLWAVVTYLKTHKLWFPGGVCILFLSPLFPKAWCIHISIRIDVCVGSLGRTDVSMLNLVSTCCGLMPDWGTKRLTLCSQGASSSFQAFVLPCPPPDWWRSICWVISEPSLAHRTRLSSSRSPFMSFPWSFGLTIQIKKSYRRNTDITNISIYFCLFLFSNIAVYLHFPKALRSTYSLIELYIVGFSSVQFSSVAQSCPTLWLWFFLWSCIDVRVGLWRRLSAEELMLLNCGGGEDSWESLGLQGDPTSPFWRRSALGFLWKEWC